MDIKSYIKEQHIEVETEEDLEYLNIPTDYHTLRVRYDEKRQVDSLKCLIRFVNSELFETFPPVHSTYFLPSDISKKLNEHLRDPAVPMDPSIVPFFANSSDDNWQTYESINKDIIKNKSKGDVSTSFFRYYNIADEDAITAVEALANELTAVQYDAALIGEVPHGLGILEAATVDKTKDPLTRHYNFWKFANVDDNKPPYTCLLAYFSVLRLPVEDQISL